MSALHLNLKGEEDALRIRIEQLSLHHKTSNRNQTVPIQKALSCFDSLHPNVPGKCEKARPKKLFLSNSSSLLLHTLDARGTKRALVRLRLFPEHIANALLAFLLLPVFLSSESLNAQRFRQHYHSSSRSSSHSVFGQTYLRLVDPLHGNLNQLLISFVFLFSAFFDSAFVSRHVKRGELKKMRIVV
ncbi:unnamed protein product [Sphenostylis stenocarpa]|uniref:Uncharacterized protein n=1 Tax=Sphenostylis stenocarpa TaxID=92480 RepID=A0AA86W383_9FABA|nr:unnamed protein product [Sphenostylis stenocarpa]